jgi:cob(I)alamin adenosyltransferase
MSFYTRKGDDGTTGLLYGGRARKDAGALEATGAVDEAQATIGVARAEVERGSEVDTMLLDVERDLYVLMAELATLPENQRKLTPGASQVTSDMVLRIERQTDEVSTRFEMPKEFVLPGQTRLSALLEVARTVVRRAERRALAATGDDSQVIPYLNRLSSRLYAIARWQEGESIPSKPRTN